MYLKINTVKYDADRKIMNAYENLQNSCSWYVDSAYHEQLTMAYLQTPLPFRLP